ncbi:ABC transporter ATP-binding protein [Photobacterium sanctipauli]|uniref:ABC transporter ATP-binding protein n=1 Tax=Photobacterium sanctipauli TaxID=1342794 RepID=A0A2T3NUK4_9GAMM|nr:ABC transporter ATP-binding protein [Photobacterium sanctipauli]PSW19953.1 ABC transporter ATP-binding protein [Photobacterium sanctipauli]
MPELVDHTTGLASNVGVALNRATLRYNDATEPLFSNLSLTLPAGEWTCLLGKSGCGKTTLLRHLAGLLGDKVEWQGELTTSDDSPLFGNVAYMAQQDLLLPWLNVLDNVCLSSRFGAKQVSDHARAIKLLEAVGLNGYEKATPDQLSGGMRQRVALARTLMQDKPLVLMDEPFSALDAVTRHKLQSLSAKLLKGRTVLLITHDPQEALRLGHHIHIMSGSPASLLPLGVPNSAPPRQFTAELATHQQAIIEQLERDYV